MNVLGEDEEIIEMKVVTMVAFYLFQERAASSITTASSSKGGLSPTCHRLSMDVQWMCFGGGKHAI